jgi:hypothetical protein
VPDELVETAGPVQEAELGVEVKVDELSSTPLVTPRGALELFGTPFRR